jgi:hypothetical protein
MIDQREIFDKVFAYWAIGDSYSKWYYTVQNADRPIQLSYACGRNMVDDLMCLQKYNLLVNVPCEDNRFTLWKIGRLI